MPDCTTSNGSSASARPHLLVIENHEPTRMFVQHVLQEAYRLTLVGTAQEALERAEAVGFDAVLVDIALQSPHDGIDVMNGLRDFDAYAGVPIVAMTAYAMPGDKERFLEAGFDAYISKPFVRADILALLEPFFQQERTS